MIKTSLYVFQLSVKHLDEIEQIINSNPVVKYRHIIQHFSLIAMIWFVLFCNVFWMFYVIGFILFMGRSLSESETTMAVLQNSSVVVMVLFIIVLLLFVCCGNIKTPRLTGFIPKLELKVSKSLGVFQMKYIFLVG